MHAVGEMNVTLGFLHQSKVYESKLLLLQPKGGKSALAASALKAAAAESRFAG